MFVTSLVFIAFIAKQVQTFDGRFNTGGRMEEGAIVWQKNGRKVMPKEVAWEPNGEQFQLVELERAAIRANGGRSLQLHELIIWNCSPL